MTEPPEQPQLVPIVVGDKTRRYSAGVVVAVVATLVLGLYAFVVAGFVGTTAAMASDPCGDGDKQYICTLEGQHVALVAPVYSALIGLAVTVIGCWVWPRRWRAGWLGLGYLIAFTGFLIAVVIAGGAP